MNIENIITILEDNGFRKNTVHDFYLDEPKYNRCKIYRIVHGDVLNVIVRFFKVMYELEISPYNNHYVFTLWRQTRELDNDEFSFDNEEYVKFNSFEDLAKYLNSYAYAGCNYPDYMRFPNFLQR